MNNSMLEAVAKKKKYLKFILGIGTIVLIIISYFTYKWYKNSQIEEIIPEYAISEQKDFKVSVEEDGEIKNPQDFNLAFLTSGRIDKIFVEEGQKIKIGEKLAKLDTTALNIAIQKARANIDNYLGLIKQKQSENTDLDYIQAQEDLNSIQEEIQNKEKTTQQTVEEAFDLALVKTENGIYRIQRSLDVVDSIFGFRTGNGVNQSVFRDFIRYNDLKNSFKELSQDFIDYNNQRDQSKTYSNISQNLVKVTELNKKTSTLLDKSIYLFSNAVPLRTITQKDLTENENIIAKEKATVNQEIQNLTTAKKNTENALVNQHAQVSSTINQKNQVKVKTTNAEKMAEQRKISKEAGLSILYAQLAQAKAGLNTALYNLGLATLVAPTDGEVLDINKEIGEIVGQGEPFIKLLSDDNFIVEIYVEELDIVKIKVGQKANIRIAALNDQVLEGVVSYISSNATEDSNGVITYLVQLEINKSKETFPIKEKMTATVEFIINEVKNVVLVPVEAVYMNNNGKSSVLLADMTEVLVETGLTDNNFIEIKSGLKNGTKIIKNPLDFINVEKKEEEPEFKELLPEIKEDLAKLGFNETEIKKIEKGEMDDQLTDRLKEAQKAEKGGLSNMLKK